MIKQTKNVGSLFPRAKLKTILPLLASLAVFQANQSRAAFIVEPHSTGRASANFSANGTGASFGSGTSTALGLTATHSAFGGTGATSDIYTLSYTPGVDADNYMPSTGADLGNGDLATGGVGGVTGTYNVYATWFSAATGAGATEGTDITVNSDGSPVVHESVLQLAGHPAQNKWWKIATVELTAGQTYTVTFASRSTAYVSQRLSGVMWELVPDVTDPCVNTPSLTFDSVHGPLAAGQTTVVVSGLDEAATAVAVYKNGTTKIGELTSGIVTGSDRNQVTVEALVAGDIITATQTVNGQEGCVPNEGPTVGSGANSSLYVALSVRKATANEGPIGASGGGTGSLYFLGATGGSLSAGPSDGVVLNPDGCWQTVTFNAATDPAAQWTGATEALGSSGFVSLDGLAIKMNNGDTGPYVIYIDNLANGSTVVEDWESHSVGQTRGFLQPSFSGSTSGFLLAEPNTSVVTDLNADTGFHSERITWQFKSTASGNWLRLTTDGALPVSRPQLDLSEPITLRILVLPIGKTAADGQITAQPVGGQVWPGANHTLSVTAEGESNSYQWSKDGNSIPGATDSSYTITSANESHSGDYTVEVSNATCSKVSTSKVASITVQAVEPVIGSISGAGTSSVTVTWEAVEGITYRLQYKDDLNDSTWNNLDPVVATDTTASSTDTTATGATRFYRVVVE